MMRKLFVGVLCGLVLATAAVADETPAPAPAAQPPALAPHPDDLVCKNRILTGTRFPKRVCKTRREWEHGAYVDGKQLEGIQHQTSGTPPGMGGP